MDLNGYGEYDLLHGMWRFIYRILTNNHIQPLLGEKTGVEVVLARNKSRRLEVVKKRLVKYMGSRGDIIFTLQGQGVMIQ